MKKKIFIFALLLFFAFSFREIAFSAETNPVRTRIGNPPVNSVSGFPLRTTKSVILAGSSHNGATMVWCYTSQENCHHDYNAADIFAQTGTTVVAVISGKITQAHKSSSAGHTVHVLAGDGRIYFHSHLGSLSVSLGQNVNAGDELGTVGTAEDAMGTPPHLHFDILPDDPSYNGRRPSCASGSCTKYPFVNVQPLLIPAYQAIP